MVPEKSKKKSTKIAVNSQSDYVASGLPVAIGLCHYFHSHKNIQWLSLFVYTFCFKCPLNSIQLVVIEINKNVIDKIAKCDVYMRMR